jgi:hypothetical protein
MIYNLKVILQIKTLKIKYLNAFNYQFPLLILSHDIHL